MSLGTNYQSLKDVAAEEIRNRILDGRLPPGTRLVEDDLAKTFAISRMPVREALTILETEGFVEMTPRKGASVSVVSPAEALDIFEVRGMLEGLAARLAARSRDESSLGSLQAIVDDGARAISDGSGRMPILHQQFHVTLAGAGANSYLIELVSPLPAKVEWIYNSILRTRGEVSWPEHVEILDAVRSGDEDRAEQVTRRHVQRSAEVFLENLEKVNATRH
jgi:DNA-binding GntR family transcriptional regulator